MERISLVIQPSKAILSPCRPVDGAIRPPGSKSITNRALVCAALATGTSHLSGVLDSEDTQVMIQAWKDLGLPIDWNRSNGTATVVGCSGKFPRQSGNFYVANSGTTIRFLTAALAIGNGDFQLDGVARMRQRPIADLIDGLKQLGCDIRSLNEELPNCPPVHLLARGLSGGTATIAGNVSSQFLSGLMMAAPYAQTPVELRIKGDLVSKPYVTMTAEVMRSFGVNVTSMPTPDGQEGYQIAAPQSYLANDYAIEPDASAASYFFAAAAITGGRARVLGLNQQALQGDVAFVEVLKKMGCKVTYGSEWIEVQGRAETGIDIDMNPISDTVQTLAAVALFANGPTRVRGVAHNRHKETDRIGDLATELRRLGAKVDEHEDGLTITPQPLHGAEIQTYHDHRMAMSLALVGLRQSDVWICNPQCTEKTYPHYFHDMAAFTGQNIALA